MDVVHPVIMSRTEKYSDRVCVWYPERGYAKQRPRVPRAPTSNITFRVHPCFEPLKLPPEACLSDKRKGCCTPYSPDSCLPCTSKVAMLEIFLRGAICFFLNQYFLYPGVVERWSRSLLHSFELICTGGNLLEFTAIRHTGLTKGSMCSCGIKKPSTILL